MFKKIYQELVLIRKELQDIRSILEPKNFKIKLDGEEVFKNLTNCDKDEAAQE